MKLEGFPFPEILEPPSCLFAGLRPDQVRTNYLILNNKVKWTIKYFDSLTPHELYAILQLRAEVFGVEQDCVYQDLDNKDQLCFHLMGWQNEKLVAYTRLVPPGLSYTEPSIGRVVTSPAARRAGLGKTLVEKSIAEISRLYGNSSIKIGAQLYLKKFYESFDFEQSGDIYDEDGIDHILMIRK